MRTPVRRSIGIALSVVGLVVAQRILNPAPIPAAGFLLGGLLAWLFGSRLGHLALGAVLGLVATSMLHAYSHFAEGRADSFLQTSGHVLQDAALGAAIGAGLLGIALILDPSMLTRHAQDRAT